MNFTRKTYFSKNKMYSDDEACCSCLCLSDFRIGFIGQVCSHTQNLDRTIGVAVVVQKIMFIWICNAQYRQ